MRLAFDLHSSHETLVFMYMYFSWSANIGYRLFEFTKTVILLGVAACSWADISSYLVCPWRITVKYINYHFFFKCCSSVVLFFFLFSYFCFSIQDCKCCQRRSCKLQVNIWISDPFESKITLNVLSVLRTTTEIQQIHVEQSSEHKSQQGLTKIQALLP